MTGFFLDIAHASLPVAIALLILAAAACGAQWAQLDHARAQRLALLYLEPLSTWCLAAVVTYAVALVAAGHTGVLSLVFPVCVGVAALMLRATSEPDEDDEPALEKEPPASAPPAPVVAPTRASTGPLWSKPTS
jgi:hypothetical protein